MPDTTDIRWKQRFQNFANAFKLLSSACKDRDIEDYSDLELEGIVQRFEYTFELCWKLLKDYIEFNGIQMNGAFPRAVIKEYATSDFYLDVGVEPEILLEMLGRRNNMSHIYDSEEFNDTVQEIVTRYVDELQKVYDYFSEKVKNDNE